MLRGSSARTRHAGSSECAGRRVAPSCHLRALPRSTGRLDRTLLLVMLLQLEVARQVLLLLAWQVIVLRKLLPLPVLELLAPVSYTHLTLPTTPYV